MSQNPARRMRRELVKAALASKVVAKIEPAPEPPAPPQATAMRQVRVAMSEEQLNLLMSAQAQVQTAQGQLDMLLRGVLAQHHILVGSVKQILPGRPPKLLVEVPDEGKGSGRRRRGQS
jgi:hypothetical protein